MSCIPLRGTYLSFRSSCIALGFSVFRGVSGVPVVAFCHLSVPHVRESRQQTRPRMTLTTLPDKCLLGRRFEESKYFFQVIMAALVK